MRPTRGALRSQWERKARIEVKIGGVVAVLNVFAGFVLLPRTGVAANAPLAGAILTVRVGALLALSGVLLCWFLAVRVGGLENLNVQVFADDDGTTADADFPHRYRRVRDNLADALANSIPLIERRATWIRRCETAAVLAYLMSSTPDVCSPRSAPTSSVQEIRSDPRSTVVCVTR